MQKLNYTSMLRSTVVTLLVSLCRIELFLKIFTFSPGLFLFVFSVNVLRKKFPLPPVQFCRCHFKKSLFWFIGVVINLT